MRLFSLCGGGSVGGNRRGSTLLLRSETIGFQTDQVLLPCFSLHLRVEISSLGVPSSAYQASQPARDHFSLVRSKSYAFVCWFGFFKSDFSEKQVKQQTDGPKARAACLLLRSWREAGQETRGRFRRRAGQRQTKQRHYSCWSGATVGPK